MVYREKPFHISFKNRHLYNSIIKGIKMANIITTALSAYVEEHRLPLIKRAILGANSLNMINRQSGVKGTAALNLISTNPIIGDASNCGFESSGTSELSQRMLVTKPLKVNMEFCEKTLKNTWAEYNLRWIAEDKAIPYEEYVLSEIADKVAAKVEEYLWMGDSGLGLSGLTQIASADGATEVTVGTGASAYEAIQAVYMAIPEAILDRAVIFVPVATFRSFMQDLVEKNYFHYDPQNQNFDSFLFPGTNVRVQKVNGLKDMILAADPQNLFYGYDIADANETFDVWYSKDDRVERLVVEWNQGAQIAYPDEVVFAAV